MIDRTITCDTFSIVRTLAATPERVFAAFADVDIKTQMLAPSDGDSTGDLSAQGEFDFRVGGHERFEYQDESDRVMKYDATYYDIVPDQRIVYSYEMYEDGARLSVSVVSLEFLRSQDATTLVWTEQGAFLDGLATNEMRRGGTEWMVDNMTEFFAAQRES